MSSIGGADRPPAHTRALDAPELDRLLALRAATTENAPTYIGILSAMVAAKDSYRLQLRTDEIVSGIRELGTDKDRVVDALRQLQLWDCVSWVQDTTFAAATVEEYLRRHELWELTPLGEATYGAVQVLLGATERSGALQRALFRQITESLEALRVAVRTNEAQGVYLRLRDLDSAVADLARNARDFHATITRTSREDRLEEHIFLLYKEELIAYLQTFHDDLVRNRVAIVRHLTDLDDSHRQDILRLAAEGDDSVGLFGDPSNWERRWDGMRAWFVAAAPAVSGIAQLAAATTAAIRELLALLRRLTEATTRPIDRASELTHLARWFVRLELAEAHELFDVSFGLGALSHLSIGAPDPERVPMSTSWWFATAAPVPMTLRKHGKRPSPGRTARKHLRNGRMPTPGSSSPIDESASIWTSRWTVGRAATASSLPNSRRARSSRQPRTTAPLSTVVCPGSVRHVRVDWWICCFRLVTPHLDRSHERRTRCRQRACRATVDGR